MRRPPLLALLLFTLVFGACTTPPPPAPLAISSPQPEATFVVEARTAAAEVRSEGDPIVAAVGRRFRIFDEPGDREPRLYTSLNDFGQDLWLPVVGRLTDDGGRTWLRVLVPERPNGTDGWVRKRDVEAGRVRDHIVVRLRRHSLIHYRGDRVIRRYTVAIGAPGTPTAPGRFFVWARVGYEDATGPYGNYALGLSGFSKVLTEWPGGGRMAIHGTADPGDAGFDVSYGCVRVYNPQMARLIEVPMGATVVIRP